MAYELPPLRHAYDALEPWVDARTVELHHDRHHRAHVETLNAALAGHPDLQALTVEDLLRRPEASLPEAVRAAVRDHGGGHANHQFLWKVTGPPGGPPPAGRLAEALAASFGSVDAFKARFEAAALAHFGSGWAFLSTSRPRSADLEILTLPNQGSVLPLGRPGLLCCDLWEHAYYLRYGDRRGDYLRAFWNVVDWPAVAARLDGILEGRAQL